MKALILAGGTGTRFWPLSRRRRPKQLLALDGESSLLRSTFERLQPLAGAGDVWVCTTGSLAAAVRAELPEVPARQVLAEPVGRNTAPAIAWSVASMREAEREEVVAVLPADHRMADPAAFRDALAAAARVAAERDVVVTLGVRPRWAETGYGYIEVAGRLSVASDPLRVARFTEKPDRATAEDFVRSERYLWNAGIFVFRGSVLLRELRRYHPPLAAGIEAIAAQPEALGRLYPELPEVSIDVGLAERLEELWVVPLDCGWSDLGSWQALAELLPSDDDGVSAHGEVVAIDSSDSLLWADEGTIAVLGVGGLVVVRTADAVLVAPKERSQEVRRVIEELRRRGLEELL